MVQKGQKSRQKQTSFCQVPGIGTGAQIRQPLIVLDGPPNHESELAEQSLLLQPSNFSEQFTPNSEVPLVIKEEQNKQLVSKIRERKRCRENGVTGVLDKKANVNWAVDRNLKEKELLREGSSKKASLIVGREQHCAASITAFQKEFILHPTEKRSSSLPEVRPCENDTAPNKCCVCSLLEPKQNISNFGENQKLKKKHRSALAKPELHTELKSLVERDGSSAIELKSQEVLGKSNQCCFSKPEPLQKIWYFRESRSAQPGQKSCQKQDRRQRAKRRGSSFKLQEQVQSLSLQKFKGRPRKGNMSCKLKLPSLDSEDCAGNLAKVRLSSIPHVPCGNSIVEGRISLMKSHRLSLANFRLVEPQEKEVVFQQKYKTVELTQTKSCEDLQVLKRNRHLLEGAAYVEDSKKCRSIAEGRRHSMVTRALLKSKMCESDSGKLDWKQKKSVAMEIPWFRQGILDKQIAVGQTVDSPPAESSLIARVTGYRQRQTHGKVEIVTSCELKIKTQTSRQQITEVSNAHYEKLQETTQDCKLPRLLEQSACLQITKLHETAHEDPVSCLGREATLDCDDNSFPVTKSKCPQLLDLIITENKVEKDPLVKYQDNKPRYKLNDSHCTVTKNPVVRLLDCSYIRALANPTSDQKIQSCNLHCELLHVALGQRKKTLAPNRGMGQNDLNSSSNIVQAGRSLSQTSILVGKGMCQNRKTSPRYQNGKKRFRESKWCLEFKKTRKRIKMSEDLEKSTVQDDTDLYSEYKLPVDKNATADSSIITEELNCNKTVSLTSLDATDFLLERGAQKNSNQLVTLSSSEQKSKLCFVPCDLEKSELKKENSVLESKTMEPHADFSNVVDDDSIVELQVGEKISNCSNNIDGYMRRGNVVPKEKTISKAGKKLQFSCQRAVPFSGKNIWPHESCARTSWFYKNYASGLEFLRGPDFFGNSDQMELHKVLVDTSKAPVNKIMDCKTELSVKSPTTKSHLHIDKAFSSIGNKNGISSTVMERPKQCPPKVTKNAKKYRITLSSPVKEIKNDETIAKKNASVGSRNGMFVASSKNKTKSLVSKQDTAVPQVLKTLSTGNLSNFKIPLLKDNSISRKERNSYSPLNIVDDSTASVKRDRSKRDSVYVSFEHLFHSEQFSSITVAAVEEHAGQLDRSVSGSLPRESNVYKKDLTPSLEGDLESSTLKEISSSLSNGCTKKPTKSSVVSSEINENHWRNTLPQNKDNCYADVLKAYEDDALVIDVIQDDPDLFGNIDDLNETDSEEHFRSNYSASKEKLELKSEFSPLPRNNPLISCPRKSPIEAHDTLRLATADSTSLMEVDKIKSDSISATSLTRGTTELSFEDGQLTKSEDRTRSPYSEKHKFSEEMVGIEEKSNSQETGKMYVFSETTELQPASLDQQLDIPLPPVKAFAPQWQGPVVKPWMNDFRFSWKGPVRPSSYPNSCESWKVEKNAVIFLGLTLPHGYCRLHFNTLNGCGRPKCWYWHVPEAGDEKLCNEILKKYISIGEIGLLQRAVQIFTDYCKDVTCEVQLDSQMLNDLLTSLLQYCLLKELFHVLHTCLQIKVLPAVDILLQLFEHVASMKLKEAVPELIDISSKLLDEGMALEYEHFGCITKFLNQLQLSPQEIAVFKSRFQARHIHKASIYDFGSAIAEFQHCKEKEDWTKLGIMYIKVRRGCKNVDDVEKYSLYIANILVNVVKEEKPGVPFCEFAASVNAEPRHNEADKTLLGRIGISVLYSYYRIHQWLKARKILDTLHVLQISFTYLKGLIGPERLAPRCQIVNVAVEIFLNSGSLDGAVWILKESEWVINTVSWPCDRMDVLNRHNLLCKIASEYITKKHYREAFEVLRNLPGFQNSGDSLDVSQYSFLFNKLLGASSQNKSFGISSTVIDFMLAKNIPVEFNLLRAFITALGRSSLWLKARTYYRSALALGCYPSLEGNLYRKLLLIPSYITEIEMLLAIEIFLVSNASSIQSPGVSNQVLQIVLKRCEGNSVRNKDDYQSAVERLIQATQLAMPKLFLKHLTVNVSQECVYCLEHVSVLKWLKDNMKWAGKVWLFQ